MNAEESTEPEVYLSSAKYLLELVQMDLNFSRKETVPARISAALDNVYELSKIFPLKEKPRNKEEAQVVYSDYSDVIPTEVGLYSVKCGEINWDSMTVAVIKNDFQMTMVHCSIIGTKEVRSYHNTLEGTLWKRLA